MDATHGLSVAPAWRGLNSGAAAPHDETAPGPYRHAKQRHQRQLTLPQIDSPGRRVAFRLNYDKVRAGYRPRFGVLSVEPSAETTVSGP